MTTDTTRESVSQLFSSIITPLSCSLQYESQEIILQKDSLAHRLYERGKITEKFNCNYSLNEQYQGRFHNSALRPVGVNPTGDIRMIELNDHPFYLAMLFQPQLAPQQNSGHPIIKQFLISAQSFKNNKRENKKS